MQSLYLLAAIVLFFILALAISNHLQRKKGNAKEREATPPAIDLGGGACCGAHEVCVKNRGTAALTEKPEYFDDEELDRFAHRNPNEYTAGETAEFREIFLSVLDSEKPRWLKSLQLRDIALPRQLKEEALWSVNEPAVK